MSRPEPFAAPSGSTVAYTDGACRGNPGPGGWAWAIPHGAWAAGYDPATTNQRMEILAAFQALQAIEGPVHIVSDSTYVVNCFRDEWWRGWQKRGWKNSKKEPVANRDLWEPFIELALDRQTTFDWVKGHSGDPMNDVVDRLAVAVALSAQNMSGEGPPTEEQMGPPDSVGLRSVGAQSVGLRAAVVDLGADRPALRDSRIPEGSPYCVVGLRSADLAESELGKKLRRHMSEVLRAQAKLRPDLVVLTGLRPGAEQIAAEAATDAGIPYVVVLPYPDPAANWLEQTRSMFQAACEHARSVVTLEKKLPADAAAKRAALGRRDGWLRSVSLGALVVTDGVNGEADLQFNKFSQALGDEVWQLEMHLLR
ncbi:MAG: RNase H family protein [Microthrixaceae bacterium]